MRWYHAECVTCGWKTRHPMEEAVKDGLGPICRDCRTRGLTRPLKYRETLVVGPTQVHARRPKGEET